MNRFITGFLLLCPILYSLADDGSWNANYSLSGGALYSEAENPDVALSDEILIFDGFDSGVTRAVFFFTNTSAKDLEVQAGFPIRVRLFIEEDVIPGTKEQKGYYFRESKYGPPSNSVEYARVALGDSLKKGAFPEDEDIGHSWEYFLVQTVPVRRELPAKELPDWFDFSITQDGNKVDISTIVTEAVLVKEEKDESPFALDVTFHFRHVLKFKARAVSRVEVRYTSDCASSGDRGGAFEATAYSYTYILGTGRTWKGPINRLYLVLPIESAPELPNAFQRMGRKEGREIYLAEQYEPAPEDVIEMGTLRIKQVYPAYLNMIWFDSKKIVDLPKKPAQEFVVVKGASSFLKETADAYTLEGIIPKAEFGPLSLFDGVPETAWCEGVRGDGIGEWVEFELKQEVEAIEVWNGYRRVFAPVEGKNLHQYYEWNNRVKTLEILSTDGRIRKTLNLADSNEKQTFEDVYLPKGSYRAIIRAVYKGTKWPDTCLGEIVFRPAAPLYQRLKSDQFLREQIMPLLK